MPSSTSEQFAHLVRPDPSVTIDVLGPTIQYVTSPAETGAPCVMHGTIPPGARQAAAAVCRASPSRDEIARFLQTAEQYGYWNATPEENARVGIAIPNTP